ncbi:alpha/beta hydrolase family protein [Saccharothrix syringae]|uniref:Alpha/beta hydrolase n=1 Tax=Saccharothrix syringae TaxID=103733 RepID=A0A5Q0H0N3_SACSY|nr:alpha/beta hydrolase [Saccharothrix syringae]QFZ19222.1 alpha/beta hydrolase [Saccharothrix syringae]
MGEQTHDITFPGAGVTLAGSLTVPDRDGPVPGVLLVGGSGPSDRHNDTHFPPIRAHLVAAGFAVLSYDKRGVGGSSGAWQDGGLDDLAADALAAWEHLRARPGVLAGATGLFGHSEGGWVVLRAATGRDDVPWLVVNGCPGMTPAEQDRYAFENFTRRAGGDVEAVLAVYDRVVEAARRGADFAEATRLATAPGVPPEFTENWDDVDERLWGFLKRKQDHDPVPDIAGLRCPLLAVFGGADELVPVVDSARLFTAAATRPDRPRGATLATAVFPGANHRVQVDGPDHLAPGYLDALTAWIRDRAESFHGGVPG